MDPGYQTKHGRISGERIFRAQAETGDHSQSVKVREELLGNKIRVPVFASVRISCLELYLLTDSETLISETRSSNRNKKEWEALSKED